MVEKKEEHTTFEVGPISESRMRKIMEDIWKSGGLGREALREELINRVRSGLSGLDAVKYWDNPVLDVGAPGAWDDWGVCEPTVVKNPVDEKYYLFYTGFQDNIWPNKKVRIGVATSSDGLPPFTKYTGNPVLNLGGAGAWDEGCVSLQGGRKVFYDYNRGKWRMYYVGWLGTGSIVSVCGEVGLAESDDLLHWTKYAANPVLSPPAGWGMRSISVVYLWREAGTDAKYELICALQNLGSTEFRYRRYTSPDGVVWTYDREILPPAHSLGTRRYPEHLTLPGYGREELGVHPYRNMRLFLWEDRGHKDYCICFGGSLDGRHYWEYAGNPILATDVQDSSQWEQFSLGQVPCPLFEQERVLLYYTGYSYDWKHRIGVAFLNPSLFDKLFENVTLYLWDGESISAGGSTHVPLNLMRYKRRSLSFMSDTAGILSLYVDAAGDGDFDFHSSLSINNVNIYYKYHFPLDETFTLLRLVFNEAATVTAKITVGE